MKNRNQVFKLISAFIEIFINKQKPSGQFCFFLPLLSFN